MYVCVCGSCGLQWLGEADLRHKMQGRLVLVHLMCRDMAAKSTAAAAAAAAAGGHVSPEDTGGSGYATGSCNVLTISPYHYVIRFSGFLFSIEYIPPPLTANVRCAVLAGQSALANQNLFSPCVAFRVVGQPVKMTNSKYARSAVSCYTRGCNANHLHGGG